MEDNNTPVQPTEEKKGFNPMFIFTGIFLVGLIGVFLVTRGNKPTVQQPSLQEPTIQNTQGGQTSSSGANVSDVSTSVVPAGPVKEFTVNGSNFEFDPATIKVKKGDTVKISFVDDDGMHNLVIDGYNVSTKTIGPGKQDSVTFVADKAGSFKYFCSVSNHQDLGMVGTLVVE